jgi:hypothetical protein
LFEQLSLVDIESAEWADGTGLVIALNVKNDSRLLLRCVADARDAVSGNNNVYPGAAAVNNHSPGHHHHLSPVRGHLIVHDNQQHGSNGVVGANGSPNKSTSSATGFLPLAHSASSPTISAGSSAAAALCTTPGQLKDWLRAIQVNCGLLL